MNFKPLERSLSKSIIETLIFLKRHKQGCLINGKRCILQHVSKNKFIAKHGEELYYINLDQRSIEGEGYKYVGTPPEIKAGRYKIYGEDPYPIISSHQEDQKG